MSNDQDSTKDKFKIENWSKCNDNLVNLEAIIKINQHEIAALTINVNSNLNCIRKNILKYNTKHQSTWVTLFDDLNFMEKAMLFTKGFEIVYIDRLVPNKIYQNRAVYKQTADQNNTHFQLVYKKINNDTMQYKKCYLKKKTSIDGICYDGRNVHILIKNKHYIWNIKNHVIEILPKLKWNFESNVAPMIFIPSQNIILLIGGYDSINQCNGIWKFDLQNSIWSKLNISFRYEEISCCLTPDEKYIVIVNYDNTDLLLLNISDKNKYKLCKSKINCPEYGKCSIVITGGNVDILITIGWVRRLFQTKQFITLSLPPTYLIQMIAKWYNQKMIHIFYSARCIYNIYKINIHQHTKASKHYKINYDIIKNNLSLI